jgi:NADH dehydrogenase [ubiquinone] 1 alpha subcomplex assembly factor 1
MKLFSLLVNFLCALGLCSGAWAEEEVKNPLKKLIGFEDQATEPKWVAINDGVMGGLSKGGPEVKGGSLNFTGNLSLENNGGFSSIRTLGQKYDFSGKTAVVIRLKGDGRKYQLRLATDARFRGSAISYGAEFATEKEKWIEVKVPFDSLSPSWRGMKLKGPEFDSSKVEELGFLIGDKKSGEFEIEVDWIAVE